MSDFIQQLIDVASAAAAGAHHSAHHAHNQVAHHVTTAEANPQYAPVAHERGYFHDKGSSTGTSYSNGQDAIQRGVHQGAGQRVVGADGQAHQQDAGLSSPMQILMIGSHAHHHAYAPPQVPQLMGGATPGVTGQQPGNPQLPSASPWDPGSGGEVNSDGSPENAGSGAYSHLANSPLAFAAGGWADPGISAGINAYPGILSAEAHSGQNLINGYSDALATGGQIAQRLLGY